MTNYVMKPYSRIILNRRKEIFNYRLSRARYVVECAFEIVLQNLEFWTKRVKQK